MTSSSNLNMAKRGKQIEKLDPVINGEEEDKTKPATAASSDDEEANEDLSLKIVEKHLLMRATKLGQANSEIVLSEDKKDGVVDLSSSSSLESNGFVEGRSRGDKSGNGDVMSVSKKIRRRKKTIEKTEIGNQSVIVAKEEEKKVETAEIVGKEGAEIENVDPNSVEIADNVVLRKLLRGPRYFDPPDSVWKMCYNCGEEGHMAVNCKSASKRKKPCFLCGNFDHGAKQCSKGHDCFICKKSGHRAKDCPEKQKSGFQNAKICLKCGGSGHDMFSCYNDYSLDDLKEIQCYICKRFGHLCCANVTDTGPTEVSCFRCGQLGHTGLACTRSRGDTTDTGSPSSCYKCGEAGHFARECSSSAKVRKRTFESSTPTLKPHRGNQHYRTYESAPIDNGKRKKIQYEERGVATPRKSKQRGGWTAEDPEEFFYEEEKSNRWRSPAPPTSWRSPATPTSRGHRISAITAGGHTSSSQSSRKNYSHHRYSASRFDNSGSDRIMRNNDWW